MNRPVVFSDAFGVEIRNERPVGNKAVQLSPCATWQGEKDVPGPLIGEDDLSGLIGAFRDRYARWAAWRDRDTDADWTEKWWFAKADAIREADFNLDANRHRPQNRAKVEHRDPLEIIDELRAIEREMLEEIDALADAVRGAVAG